MRRIKEAEFSEPTQEQLLTEKVRAYLRIKETITELTKESNALRTELSAIVDSLGEPDDSGSLWLELPEEIDGVRSIKRERRVSQKLDEDVAFDVLSELDLLDRCVATVEAIDQDEVMACVAEELIHDEDLEVMFPTSVTWALVTSKKR